MASLAKIRRLLRLIERLQCGQSFNTRTLATFCGVSRRTIFRDLSMLQECGLPLIYDDQRQGYRLAAAPFLPPADLTLAETLALVTVACQVGRQDGGLPLCQSTRDAGLKLLSNLPRQLQHHVGDATALLDIRLPPVNPLSLAAGHHELLLRGLLTRRSVRLRYHSLFEQTTLRTLLSPYRLFFARRSWYAIGRSSVHRAVRTFHLGRILESEPTDLPYEIPLRFNLARYFGNAWQMIRERGQRNHVIVRFLPKVATNVAEVAWHKTQQCVWNPDGSLDFHATVDGLQEIAWWILGYGDQAEVLAPSELRTVIAGHARRMQATYRRRPRHVPEPVLHAPHKASSRPEGENGRRSVSKSAPRR
jgi:proteasome accessory factor B